MLSYPALLVAVLNHLTLPNKVAENLNCLEFGRYFVNQPSSHHSNNDGDDQVLIGVGSKMGVWRPCCVVRMLPTRFWVMHIVTANFLRKLVLTLGYKIKPFIILASFSDLPSCGNHKFIIVPGVSPVVHCLQ